MSFSSRLLSYSPSNPRDALPSLKSFRLFLNSHLHIAHPNNPFGVAQGSDLLLRPTSQSPEDPIQQHSEHASVGKLPGFYVSEDSCLKVLSFCKSRPLKEGVSVHSPIIKLGLEGHLFLNNNLLALYSRCYGVAQARKLFDGLPYRDVVSWTGIISAYTRSGDDEEAVELFEQMLISGSIPNEFTYSSILRCATSLRSLDLGTRTHAQIVKLGFGSNVVLESSLVDFYSKCDELEEAYEIFTMMDYRDTVSWTAMISAFVQAEDWSRAMQLYASMIESRVPPNEFTFAKLLTACGFLGSRCGESVHAHLILWGVGLNLVLKTALVDMYSKCHRMGDAQRVLNQTPESDVMLWTTVVSGYTQSADFREAMSMFRKMEVVGVTPNSFTYAGILKACSSLPALGLGEQIHARVIKAGLEHDVSVSNGLMDLYTKCSPNAKDPVRVFEGIISPNVISWTALIAGLVRHGRDGEAFAAFTEMRVVGVQPNSFTVSTILKGCVSVEAFAHARKLHAYVLKAKLDSADITVGNSLLDVYARFGKLDEARKVYDNVPYRDVFTYTSLAKGMNQMGLHGKALEIIACMREDNVKMDDFSLACFLSASAGLAAMESGKQLHCHSVKSGFDSQISVSNSLVDMYGKCGSIDEARRVFSAIQELNVVSWNGLIWGLASNGRFSEALSTFEDMRLAGTQPDDITFLLVLYACSHGGLVDLGVEYFNCMRELHGVSPQLDHYICLVDLLGRAGRLEEAACTIETMPFQPDALIYKTLLGSCKLHGNLVLGECMARRAIEMEPNDPAVYVLLSSMYDDAGKVELGEQIRRMMRERGMRKCPGQSWMGMRN